MKTTQRMDSGFNAHGNTWYNMRNLSKLLERFLYKNRVFYYNGRKYHPTDKKKRIPPTTRAESHKNMLVFLPELQKKKQPGGYAIKTTYKPQLPTRINEVK